jgi:ferredoxin-NADP reductase
MAGTAVLGRLTWRAADLVDVMTETPRATTLVFDVPGWAGHRAGQHVDVRLTAEDGYQTERSYSISSAPDGTRIALTVVHTLTASRPPGWTGYARRVDADMLAEIGPSPAAQPHAFVCGPTPFVEAVAEALVTLGHEPRRVKTERFGPTGD